MIPRNKERLKGFVRLFMHFLAVALTAGVIIFPLYYPETFDKNVYNCFIYHKVGSIIKINFLGVSFSVIIVAKIVNYYLLNLRRIWQPTFISISEMLEKSAQIQFELGTLCTDSIVNAKQRAGKNDIAGTKEVLNKAMQFMLNAIDSLVHSYMDTVLSRDMVTSNLMIALTEKVVRDKTIWRRIRTELKNELIYTKDGCENKNCIAWLRMIKQSTNASQELPHLDRCTLRVHRKWALSTDGAALAYHKGRKFLSLKHSSLEFSAVNNVYKIQWSRSLDTTTIKNDSIKHFKKLERIKSFVSMPIIRQDEVVAVLNINSSNDCLGGFTEQQKNILKSLVYPILPYLADILFYWRKIEYEKEK
jgi:hypothetical protein